MVCETCSICGHQSHWEWIEAFSKFGFDDGDDPIETWTVSTALEKAGYKTKLWKWGVHNTLIISLVKNGTEFMPVGNTKYRLGYDHPRKYLPEEVINLLDEAFPTTSTYRFP